MSDPLPFDRTWRKPVDLDPDAPLEPLEGKIVVLSDMPEGEDGVSVDPATGAVSIEQEDGGVIVELNPQKRAEDGEDKHYANLADKISDYERGRIVDEVMRGVQADDESRSDWLEMRAEGVKMLGTKLERAQADLGASMGPFEGMSTVRHPLLLEAIVRFQANAGAELYPPNGPVKVRDDRPAKPGGIPDTPNIGHNGGPALDAEATAEVFAADQATREELAEALEKGFNHNLTAVDRGYRPDSIRMLFWVAFGGCAFKKIYDCPIKQRPVSRFVDAADIIVDNTVSDHRDAGRITHRIVMRHSMVRRMQIAGVYRDTQLHEPQYQPNAVEEAVAAAQGLSAKPSRQEDQPRTLYESYVELDIEGYEHKDKGKPSGIPRPWKVTIDKDARELLELRRNWEEDDPTETARQVIVKFSFMPAMGFYDLGLLHLLGNGDKALTAAWRIALDTAMFGNFPGFIYNEGFIRNWTNQNRVPPGGGIAIKGIGNVPLDQVIKPLPYKDLGTGLIGMIQHVEQRMDRVGGTAELPVGEGRQDAPVGTTLALIEQSTKILAAAHVNLHDAQSEEFQLLKDRYKANPEAFWRWNKKGRPWEREMFLRALDDYELVPAADPNTPSHMIRLIKCQAVKTVAMLRPELYDMRKVDAWIYKMIGVSDPDQFFAPPPDPSKLPPDPTIVATQMQLQARQQEVQAKLQGEMEKAKLKAQTDAAKAQLDARMQAAKTEAEMAALQIEAREAEAERRARAQESAIETADRAADRESDEKLAVLKLQVELLTLQMEEMRHRQALENERDQADRERAYKGGQADRDRFHKMGESERERSYKSSEAERAREHERDQPPKRGF